MGYICGKVMGNNTAVNQVIWLLFHYSYCLMLDIWGKHIRNKNLTIKFFLDGNLVDEKPNSFISLPTPFQIQWTAWKYTLLASIKIKSLLLWMKFYQEPKLTSNLMKGHLSTNWKPSRKNLIVNILLQIFFLKCPTLGNINNIIITI